MKLRNNKNKNLIRAANKFQPWDYEFLLELEKQSLIIMHNFYSAMEDITEYNDTTRKQINLALKLLDIVLEKDTFTEYINIRNQNRFGFGISEYDSFLKKELRKEKAWHLYNLIREKKMRYWWD